MQIFLFYVNVHESVTSAKENFNNQVDKMTHSVNSSQPRSPATPIQQAHEQSGHGGRNGGYAWAQLHRLPVT